MKRTLLPISAFISLLSAQAPPKGAAPQDITSEERQKIEAAIPKKAAAKPLKPRKLLVMNTVISKGQPRRGHPSIPHGNLALELTGKQTGAWTTVFSDDVQMFRPEKIKEFDAICFMNTTGVLTEDKELRLSLAAFIRNGGGLATFHAGGGATFVEYPKYDQFPEFGVIVGGYENMGHPWKPNETITIKVDDPKHPVARMFKTPTFQVQDEVFQYQSPYSREASRVLLSIDTARTDMNPARRFLPERLADMDFAMSWIKAYGQGRVFCTSFGHNKHMFWDPALLEHYMAGLQYALGDLKADDTPSRFAKKK